MATADGFTEQDLEEGAAHGEDLQESDESQDNNPSEDSYWSRLKRLIDERVPEESEKFKTFKELCSQFIDEQKLANMRKPSDIICEFERKKTVEFGKGYHTDILQKLLQKIGHDELALILKLNEPQTIMGGPLPMDNLNNKLRRTVNDPGVKKKIFRGRVMLVGAFGSGKSSTKRSLFNEDFEANHISTDGADIYGVDITKWICKGNRTERHSQPDPKEIQEMLEDTIISDMKKQTPIIYDDEERQDQQLPATLEGGPQQSIEMDLKRLGETDRVFFSRIQDRQREVQDVGLIDTHYSLWDFAGESLYYITHQAFLGNRVIYLLVTDLTKSLDDIVTATLNDQESDEEHLVGEWMVKDFLCFWMNSIHSYQSLDGEKRDMTGSELSAPPVIVVGTKKDLLQEVLASTDNVDTLADGQLKKIKKYIDSRVFSAANTHIDRYIAIDNKSRQNRRASDAAVERLRQRIRELSTDDYFCDEVPVKWIHLELLLRKQKKDTLELKEVYKLGADLQLDTNSVDEALVYLHSVGEILHYDSLPELREKVIVNIGWLVNLFRVLITKAITYKDDLRASASIAGQAKEFLHEGILYETLVDDVLKKENRLNDKKIILKTMELYDILSEVPRKTSDAQNKAKYYVPCFLTKELDKKEKDVVSGKNEPCCPIFFHFRGNFLPEGLFYRFVVRCLRIWPSESIPLYKNYARFFVRDKRFHFIVHRIGADIMLRALTQSENQQFHPTTFHDLRCTAEGELQHVVGTYAPGLSFGVCVKCSGGNHTHEGLRRGSMDIDDGCVQVEDNDGTASAVCRILQDDIHPPNLKSWYFKTSQMLFATPWVKPSEQPEEIQRKRPRFSSRSLLFINDELGTQKGGISTVNRLISGLATETGKVYATALNTDDTDDVCRKGIKLILPKVLSGRSPDLDWLNSYYTVHFPEIQTIPDLEVIIGHQPVTSQAALNIRNEWFPSKKVILFNHVIPEDTDVHKDEWTPSTVQQKEKEICDQAKKADVIFSVGHRIYSHFQNKFRSHRSIIHELFIPQPDESFF